MFSSSRQPDSENSSFSQSFSSSFSKPSRSHYRHKSFNSFNTEAAGGIKKRRRHESMSAITRRPFIADSSAPDDFDVLIAAGSIKPSLSSAAIVTIIVGRDQCTFAAREDILCLSPFFLTALHQSEASPSSSSSSSILTGTIDPLLTQLSTPIVHSSRRLNLPDEDPEIFSSVLEFLYRGDYHPRLVHDKRRDSWELEGSGHSGSAAAAAACLTSAGGDHLLKDTVVYCAAERYGLEDLKKIALRKQGLHSGIQCSIILASARYAYAHTPDTDSKLRAHYLALIIRSRNTFKRSGTMQREMFIGGSQLFFDLFVALCDHVDDVSAAVA